MYRADDLKLGQAVALKILPVSVATDEARLQRFLNEVKIARPVSLLPSMRTLSTSPLPGARSSGRASCRSEDGRAGNDDLEIRAVIAQIS